MFQYPLYQRPRYSNLAILAEARAAEAEFFALEASRVRALEEQTVYWAQSAPAYYPNRYQVQPAPYTYPPGLVQPRHPLDSYPRGYSHQYLPPSTTERDLHTRLKEERLARLRVEHELKVKEQELREREEQLSHFDLCARRAHLVHPSTNAHNDGTAARCSRIGYPAFAQQTRPEAIPVLKRAPEASPEDIKRMVIRSLFGAGPTEVVEPESAPEATHEDIEKMALHSLFGVPLEAKAEPREIPKRAEVASKQSPETKKPTPEGSLIDQLRARYDVEGEDEVRDTIQAVINSLSDILNQPPSRDQRDIAAAAISSLSSNPSRRASKDVADPIWATINALSAVPSTKSVPRPTSTASSSSCPSSSAGPSFKGKDKETFVHSGPKDVINALERVESIEHTFKHLEADFVFPSQLDFISTSDVSSDDLPHLAYTARNHSVRYYEQTLSTLLSQLDLIESHGNATLRQKRKDAVDLIEKALEEVEREIDGRWKAKLATKQKMEEASKSEDAAAAEAPRHARIPITDNEDKTEDTQLTVGLSESSGHVGEASKAGEDEAPEVPSLESIHQSEGHDNEIVEERESELALSPPSTGQSLPVLETSPSLSSLAQPHGDGLAPELLLGTLASVGSDEQEASYPGPDDVTTETDTLNTASSEPVPTTPQEIDADSESSNDTFLLARRNSPQLQPKNAHSKRASVEDLGSDWSDLDA